MTEANVFILCERGSRGEHSDSFESTIQLNASLTAEGLNTYFVDWREKNDSEQLKDRNLSIQNCAFLLVVVTKRYQEQLLKNYNGSFEELKYATRQKGQCNTVVVTFENEMRDKRTWSAVLYSCLENADSFHLTKELLLDAKYQMLLKRIGSEPPPPPKVIEEESRNAEKILESRNCSVIQVVNMMLDNELNETIQWKACEWICNLEPAKYVNLLNGHRSRRKLLVENGGPALVLKAMENHLNSENVQAYACGTLYRIARDPEIAQSLIKMNAGARILAAIERHIYSKAVLKNGFRSMANIVYNNDALNAEIMQLGAGELIIKVMEVNVRDPIILAKSCDVLKHMCQRIETFNQMLSLGMIQHIANSMENHPSATELQEEACVVVNMMSLHEKVHPFLMRLDVARLLIKAVTENPNHNAINEHAVLSIGRLGTSSLQNRMTLRNLGCVNMFRDIKENAQLSGYVRDRAVDSLETFRRDKL